MEKQDLKNLLENIYHLLAEEGEWHPPMLLPPEDPNWSPLQPPPPWWTDGPEPTWQSPLGPDYVAPRLDPILNPAGPGNGTIIPVGDRIFFRTNDGRLLLWDYNIDPPRWVLYPSPSYYTPAGNGDWTRYILPWSDY